MSSQLEDSPSAVCAGADDLLHLPTAVGCVLTTGKDGIPFSLQKIHHIGIYFQNYHVEKRKTTIYHLTLLADPSEGWPVSRRL